MSDTLKGFFASGLAQQQNTAFQQDILARDQERQDAEFAQQLVEQTVKQGKSLSDLAKTLIENSPDPSAIPRDTLAGIGATIDDLATALERKSPTDALALRQTFATVLGSSKTLAQQAEQAGRSKALEKGAEVEGLAQIPGADRTAVLRGQGLQERPRAVAAGDSRPKPQNFQLPDGSYTAVDLNSPAGAARARQLIDEGAVAVGVSVQAGEGGLLKPPGATESREVRDLEVATLNVLDETANLREQLASGDVFTSLAGGVLGTLASAAGNIQQAAELAGVEQPDLAPEGYDFSKFEERAGTSAAFKSNAINLAYLLARASDPGGRVSDKDLQAQLDRIGTNAGNRAGMLKVLDEVDRGVTTNLRNRRKVLEAGAGGALPPVSDPRLAGGGGGIPQSQVRTIGDGQSIPPQGLRPFQTGEFINNGDGSRSTERSRTFPLPSGEWVNAPSLWMTPEGPVEIRSEDQIARIVQDYEKRTGQRFPRFKSQQEAVAAARKRSDAGAVFSGPLAGSMTAETVASMPAPTLRSRVESMSVQELDALPPAVRAAIAAKLRGGK